MPFSVKSVNYYYECIRLAFCAPLNCSVFHVSQLPLHLGKKITDRPNKAKKTPPIHLRTKQENLSERGDRPPAQSMSCRTPTDPERFCCVEHFLSGLQPIQNFTNLPKCPIWLQNYGTSTEGGLGELPVRLPHCGHLYGLDCLTRWISPESGNNTCGYCRRVFFSNERDGYGDSEDESMDDVQSTTTSPKTTNLKTRTT